MRRGGWVIVLLGATLGPVLGANIRSVELVGMSKLPPQAFRERLPIRQGEPFVLAQAEQARDWLAASGLFIEVTLEHKEVGQVVDVTFRVKENPLVRAVQIQGNAEINSAALRPLLQTRPLAILDRRKLAQDVQLIGAEYLKLGLEVVVETSYDPPPLDPDQPTVVTFQVTELKVGHVRVEPLTYVTPEGVARFVVLREGELLKHVRLVEQGRKLLESGLFLEVGPPNPVPSERPDQLDVVYTASELPYPLLTADRLPLVDLDKLRQAVRLQAVRVSVDGSDLDLYVAPETARQRLAAAAAAVQQKPGDSAALYDEVEWTRRTGASLGPVLERARPVLEERAKDGTAVDHLRFGRVLQLTGDLDGAAAELGQAVDDPVTQTEAYKELITLRAAQLQQGGQEAIDQLRRVALDGTDALVKLPDTVSLEELTAAFQFYHTALSISYLNIGVRHALGLGGPVSRHLVKLIAEVADRAVDEAALRQLGKLITAVGFVAQTLGPEAASPEVRKEFDGLLATARAELLTKGIETAPEPDAWFYVALNDIVRGDLSAARQAALAGLKGQPQNERLVDAYLLTGLATGYTGLSTEKSVEVLRELLQEIDKLVADGGLRGWGADMLVAKLNMALRDGLDAADPAPREQARQRAEVACRKAIAEAPDNAAGYWLLGMIVLKGPEPAPAVAVYQKVRELRGQYRELPYALALAQLASGDTEGGLKAMERLAQR